MDGLMILNIVLGVGLLIGIVLKIYTSGRLKDIEGFGKIYKKAAEGQHIIDEI